MKYIIKKILQAEGDDPRWKEPRKGRIVVGRNNVGNYKPDSL
jgi:hypothetical protein